MNAMSSVALGDAETLKAQYELLEAEMAKIARALQDETVVPTEEPVLETASQPAPAVVRSRSRQMPEWLRAITEDSPKNQLKLGQWGPTD